MLEDDDLPDLTLREEIASLICIHENGIGTRELVEAQEGTDHQGEWLSALKTADIILEMLRTREDLEATIKRVVAVAFAEGSSKPFPSCNVPGCDNPAIQDDLCRKHLEEHRDNGGVS